MDPYRSTHLSTSYYSSEHLPMFAFAKQLSFVQLLRAHGKNIDFLYFIASMCHFLPSYLCKHRAIATIRTYLQHLHLSLLPRYVLKIQPSYSQGHVRAWARRNILEKGLHWPHWQSYALSRLMFVQLPQSTWNLKLD